MITTSRAIFYSLIINLFFVFSASGASLPTVIQEGDIIFHKSQSDQSSAVEEATNSPWTHVGIVLIKDKKMVIAEAVQPVKITPINEFIARGKNKEFKIFRFKHYNPRMKTKLYSALSKYMNKNYDIYFEFSNEKIYCSELVYKVFKEVTNEELGVVQKVGELNVNGPRVKKLIEERLIAVGKELNLTEPIVTPASQINDSDMTFITNAIQ